MTLNPQLQKMLADIHAATTAHGHAFANPRSPVVKALEKDGYVSGDNNTKNPMDAQQIAYRTTEKANAHFPTPNRAPGAPSSAAATGTADSVPPASAEFVATDAPKKRGPRGPRSPRPEPTIARTPGFRLAGLPDEAKAPMSRAGRQEKYEFGKLEAPLPGKNEGNDLQYDSFFIACDAHLTDPAKQLASNVTKANKKYKDQGRLFRIVHFDNDPEFGVAGARVIRIK
jgi:hypothetical protein